VVVARLPAEQLEDVLRDLHLQRGLQVFLADEVARDQDVAEPLQRVLLLLQHLFELLSGELALLHEQVAEPVLDALGGRIGVHDHPVLERDGHGLLLLVQRQDAGLPLQPDQLEDVGEPEVLDRSL
jgi:hypothetical protein